MPFAILTSLVGAGVGNYFGEKKCCIFNSNVCQCRKFSIISMHKQCAGTVVESLATWPNAKPPVATRLAARSRAPVLSVTAEAADRSRLFHPGQPSCRG